MQDRFFNLFTARPLTCGTFDGDRGITLKQSATPRIWEKHLAGETPLGLCPILDNNACMWGALDIDEHDPDKYVSLPDIAAKIKALDIPLVVCQSRRKGAHLYLFLESPAPAAYIRNRLKIWAESIAPGCEVFPKQDIVEPGGFGNWLNMPYFGDSRKCWHDGRFLSPEEFLTLAESSKISLDTGPVRMGGSILTPEMERDAPPCIVDMCRNGIGEGSRNEAMYNFTVYAKKADPTNMTALAMDFNAQCFTRPLPFNEAKTAIKSASRREYLYKCSIEPCKSRCNSAVCITRKHGILPTQVGRNADGSEMFTSLKKIMTSPIIWELTVQDQEVQVPTEVLLDFRRLRVHIIETLTKVVPPLKNDTWDEILGPLMQNARIVSAPKVASAAGILAERLGEFLQSAQDVEDPVLTRAQIDSGYPAIVNIDNQRVAAFRGASFMEWLKRRKVDVMKPSELWLALIDAGVEHGEYLSIDGPVDVWYCEPAPVRKKTIYIEKEEY